MDRALSSAVAWALTPARLPSEMLGVNAHGAEASFRGWSEGSARTYDVIWFNRPITYLALGSSIGARHVVDLDDLEDDKAVQRLQEGVTAEGVWGGPRVPGWQRLARWKVKHSRAGWRRLQRRMLAEADHVLVSSPDDVERLPGATCIPNCYPSAPPVADRAGTKQRPTLTMVGLMSYRPNADAAAWLVQEVLPLVKANVPDVAVRLVGDAGGAVRSLSTTPGVTVTGRVERIRDELERADIAVVPLRFAGGTRVKILEAWAHGIPVVSTTVGASGLGATDGEHLLLADDPASFAAACVRLLRDPPLRQSLARNALALHRSSYDCEMVEATIADLVVSLARS